MPSAAAATLIALRGRVVTMDASSTVIQDGVVYIRDNVIIAVQPSSVPQPAGFDQASKVDTGGTIYPGLKRFHAPRVDCDGNADAAKILNWDRTIGSVEQGKRADLLVIDGNQGDAYAHLINARETDISLVLIDGVRRYGRPSLVEGFDQNAEDWDVDGQSRKISLAEDTADPDVGALTLREAYEKLADGLNRLPELAKELERPSPQFVDSMLDPMSTKWSLVLDHDEPAGITSRPHLPYKGHLTAMPIKSRNSGVKLAERPPLSQELQPEVLDQLTVADDQTFLDRLREELNVPTYVKAGLSGLF